MKSQANIDVERPEKLFVEKESQLQEASIDKRFFEPIRF